MTSGLKRYYGEGHLHFITFSCYQRLPLLNTAQARDILIEELGNIRDAMGFHLIGYVVMPEHVHLLISEPSQGTPSTVLQRLKLRVARRLRKGKGAFGVTPLQVEAAGDPSGRSGRRDFTISTFIVRKRRWRS
jgi:REP element-mobilizing transposase RayT